MQAQLTQHQWKDRVLLIFAVDSEDSLFSEQMILFEEEMAGLKDRNLVIYKVYQHTGVKPNGKQLRATEVDQLRTQYNVSENTFTAILIGKDGSEKLRRKGKLLTRALLYQTIDAMPMRRAEMKRKQGYN